VLAHFEDGTTAAGTTLIGVDGSKSATRSHLFGEKAALTTLPYVMINTIAHYSPEHTKQITETMHPFCHMGYHPEGTMFWISVMDNPDPDDISKKTFQMVATWPGVLTPEENASSATRLAVLKNRVGKYAAPFGNFVQWLPDSTVIHPDRIAIWEPLPVDHHGGLVTLAGDAAHNITFHRGQGLNIALQDAADYVNAMIKVKNGELTLAEAVDEYGKEVLERGLAEFRLSYLNTETVHKWDEFMNSPLMKDIGVSQLKKAKTE
jgi:2-polyprenyl-6-methoxyphenol hydroxylase-like FAD-dependent oxidoreductase